MKDTFEFTLKENPSEELYEMLSDVNVETTPAFTIQDTHGNIAEYVKVIRCYECEYIHYEDGLVWMCERTHSPIGGIDGYCAWAKPEFTEAVRKQLDEWEQRKEMDRKK